ncbi:hypothetical protein ACFP3Q_07235 [Nocardioides sp. GCM10027113]|uniref:hypothetical protein n=1 Tax=unclassified Nocardioides TaxID=2615069 RepID=UPI00360B7940
MVDRVVLHIGTMKTGTSYLQRVLDTGILESVGGFYAGGSFRGQARAVDSLFHEKRREPRPWLALAERVRGREGTAVYSHEFLSFASEEKVRWIVESFGGVPVEVLLTVRDQRTAIPAQWQSYVRNRGTDSWDSYVRALDSLRGRRRGRRADHSQAARTFRRSQGVPGIIRRWAAQPSVSAVGVVVMPVPGSPPELLWQRFCEAADLPAPAPPATLERQNESLGYASCEFLRRLNPWLADLGRLEYERSRRAPVQTLLTLRHREARPVLDRHGSALAGELNARILQAVDRHAARLVGSPTELPAADDGGEPATIPPADPDQLRRAAQLVWETCVPGSAAPSGDVEDLVPELGRRLAARFGP